MDDLKHQMKEYFLQYASYVVLSRAIPSIDDGLTPVQRRILETLFRLSDGKLHKVANVVGQTMQFHPHGDSSIYEALVNLANKDFLLDRQGNFGNPFTGDPAAAARYIETRLSALGKETLFNPELTEYLPSYDGRNKEPINLPAKIPLLLMQGANGIAVGMACHILPHNFCELIEAEIAVIEGREFTLMPDFPTGGIMDASDYQMGKGKVRLRAHIEIKDPKTLMIREICYGTTTEGVITSIDEAAKKGKIKIEGISDYTAGTVEIEIKLPRGQYADEVIRSLYAFTDCEVSLSSQVIVVKEGRPFETDVHEILRYHAEKLVAYLKKELEIERDLYLEKIFFKTLERIFIEKRLYKKIEEMKSLEAVHKAIDEAFIPYKNELLRHPTQEDRDKLLQIPIRRISLFDILKNQEEVAALEANLARVEKELRNVKKYAISWLKNLLEKYGSKYPRKTRVETIEILDKKELAKKEIRVGYNLKEGFVGTKVSEGQFLTCTNLDKLLFFFSDGTFCVQPPAEKYYVDPKEKKIVLLLVADKKTTISCAYIDKGRHAYAKRFCVDKYILAKSYRFIDEEARLLGISSGDKISCKLEFVEKPRQKVASRTFSFDEVLSKGYQARGVRMAPQEVKKALFIDG